MKANINAYWRLARLDKPVGAWLLLLPCWMGLALSGNFDIWLYILFAIGAFDMRAAGCVINDIVDRKFDAKVARTKTRPIASGEISVFSAVVFLVLLLAVGLLVLLQLPMLAVLIGFVSVPLFVLYPFMKRITYWPQFFLGLTFNIGILVAYAAATDAISLNTMILYLGAVCWTLGYDTIYAHQDKADDMRIGVKSTALRFGESTKYYVAIFYALFVVAVACSVSGLAGFIFLGLVAEHFAWQVRRLDIDDEALCLRMFRSNIYAGLLVVAALLMS